MEAETRPFKGFNAIISFKLLHGIAKRLDLFDRARSEFRQHNWPMDEDLIWCAQLAICFVKLGALEQIVDVPPLAERVPYWDELKSKETAEKIVKTLGLGQLLEP